MTTISRTIKITPEDGDHIMAEVTDDDQRLPVLLMRGSVAVGVRWHEWDEIVEHVSHVSHLRTQNTPDPTAPEELGTYRVCGRPHPNVQGLGCVLDTDHRGNPTIDHCDQWGHRW
jgi:hypothetical protein